jgi:hypothetical protein
LQKFSTKALFGGNRKANASTKKIETNTEVTIFYGKAKSKTFFNDCLIQQKKSFFINTT